MEAANFKFRATTLNNMLFIATKTRNVSICNLFKEWGAKFDADLFNVACCNNNVDVLHQIFDDVVPTKEMLIDAIRDDLIHLDCMASIRYLYDEINRRYYTSLPKFVTKVVTLVIKHSCWDKLVEFAKYLPDELLFQSLMSYKDEARILPGIKSIVNARNLKWAVYSAGLNNKFKICETLITGIDDEAGGEVRRQVITNLCLLGATYGGHTDLCKVLLSDFKEENYPNMLIAATKSSLPELCIMAKTAADDNGKPIPVGYLEKMYFLSPCKQTTVLASAWLDSTRLQQGLKYVFTGGFLKSAEDT